MTSTEDIVFYPAFVYMALVVFFRCHHVLDWQSLQLLNTCLVSKDLVWRNVNVFKLKYLIELCNEFSALPFSFLDVSQLLTRIGFHSAIVNKMVINKVKLLDMFCAQKSSARASFSPRVVKNAFAPSAITTTLRNQCIEFVPFLIVQNIIVKLIALA